jgi:hypothetical protein
VHTLPGCWLADFRKEVLTELRLSVRANTDFCFSEEACPGLFCSDSYVVFFDFFCWLSLNEVSVVMQPRTGAGMFPIVVFLCNGYNVRFSILEDGYGSQRRRRCSHKGKGNTGQRKGRVHRKGIQVRQILHMVEFQLQKEYVGCPVVRVIDG